METSLGSAIDVVPGPAGKALTDHPRPLFLIGTPYDGTAHGQGNGQMVVFLAGSRPAVDSAYRIAPAHGGISEGAPGLRPEYHENYYGAYFRDTEGNKLCVTCHLPPAAGLSQGGGGVAGDCGSVFPCHAPPSRGREPDRPAVTAASLA